MPREDSAAGATRQENRETLPTESQHGGTIRRTLVIGNPFLFYLTAGHPAKRTATSSCAKGIEAR